ncbi:flap structure-specific endonuclease [Ceraceosorus bombacis]|uniref:Flap structure-specific endonuclease n=1 Tax=Ceraceosorus bombacis TaxID=401625 RepID=A0A0P1BNC5_9BASI|nr:flap structure-specific endonuclease [Ceraceosorus bombacis]
MGVQGLWSLLEPSARPIKLESLEGKRLAIDSSIWLYHFRMAMRDKEGRTLHNAHVLGFLWRILKLLFYGIRPVFVFDGGAPVMKRQTLVKRRERREGARDTHKLTAQRLLNARLRQAALDHAVGSKAAKSKGTASKAGGSPAGPGNGMVYFDDLQGPETGPSTSGAGRRESASASRPAEGSASPEKEGAGRKKKDWHKDPYALPPLEQQLSRVNAETSAAASKGQKKGARRTDFRFATDSEIRHFLTSLQPQDIDMDSELFRTLPAELQYELVGDMRAGSRGTSYKRLQAMLAESPTPIDFSRAQIKGLKNRNELTQKALEVSNAIGDANIKVPIRVAGARNREYVLVRNPGDAGGFTLGVKETGTSIDKAIEVDPEPNPVNVWSSDEESWFGDERASRSKTKRPASDDDEEMEMEEVVGTPARRATSPRTAEILVKAHADDEKSRRAAAAALVRRRAKEHARQVAKDKGIREDSFRLEDQLQAARAGENARKLFRSREAPIAERGWQLDSERAAQGWEDIEELRDAESEMSEDYIAAQLSADEADDLARAIETSRKQSEHQVDGPHLPDQNILTPDLIVQAHVDEDVEMEDVEPVHFMADEYADLYKDLPTRPRASAQVEHKVVNDDAIAEPVPTPQPPVVNSETKYALSRQTQTDLDKTDEEEAQITRKRESRDLDAQLGKLQASMDAKASSIVSPSGKARENQKPAVEVKAGQTSRTQWHTSGDPMAQGAPKRGEADDRTKWPSVAPREEAANGDALSKTAEMSAGEAQQMREVATAIGSAGGLPVVPVVPASPPPGAPKDATLAGKDAVSPVASAAPMPAAHPAATSAPSPRLLESGHGSMMGEPPAEAPPATAAEMSQDAPTERQAAMAAGAGANDELARVITKSTPGREEQPMLTEYGEVRVKSESPESVQQDPSPAEGDQTRRNRSPVALDNIPSAIDEAGVHEPKTDLALLQESKELATTADPSDRGALFRPDDEQSEPGTPIAWSPSPSPAPVRLGADGFPLPTIEEIEALEAQDEEELGQVAGGDVATFLSRARGQGLYEAQQEAQAEVDRLRAEFANSRKSDEDITKTMALEIQHMLRCFGIPYLTAPMEAEAQCAELVSRKLVDGIITDDSDVFLFGGTRVYKNMFADKKNVECFLLTDMERDLGVDRQKLVHLAYLLGSDYTEGLAGVGPVLAMEILSIFNQRDGLLRFRDWWLKVQAGKDTPEDTRGKTMRRIKKTLANKVMLDPHWPETAVVEAYYSPTVDESDEPFQWGLPDLDAIRILLAEYLSWSQDKTDQYLLPVIEAQNRRRGKNQSSLLDRSGFFDLSAGTGVFAPREQPKYGSKRLQDVVERFRAAETGRKKAKSSSQRSAKRSGPAAARQGSPSDSDDATTEGMQGGGARTTAELAGVPEELVGKEMGKQRPIVSRTEQQKEQQRRRREARERGLDPADMEELDETAIAIAATDDLRTSGSDARGKKAVTAPRKRKAVTRGANATEEPGGRGRKRGADSSASKKNGKDVQHQDSGPPESASTDAREAQDSRSNPQITAGNEESSAASSPARGGRGPMRRDASNGGLSIREGRSMNLDAVGSLPPSRAERSTSNSPVRSPEHRYASRRSSSSQSLQAQGQSRREERHHITIEDSDLTDPLSE